MTDTSEDAAALEPVSSATPQPVANEVAAAPPLAPDPFALPPVSPDDPCGPDLDLEGDTDFLNFVAATEGQLPGELLRLQARIVHSLTRVAGATEIDVSFFGSLLRDLLARADLRRFRSAAVAWSALGQSRRRVRDDGRHGHAIHSVRTVWRFLARISQTAIGQGWCFGARGVLPRARRQTTVLDAISRVVLWFASTPS